MKKKVLSKNKTHKFDIAIYIALNLVSKHKINYIKLLGFDIIRPYFWLKNLKALSNEVLVYYKKFKLSIIGAIKINTKYKIKNVTNMQY